MRNTFGTIMSAVALLAAAPVVAQQTRGDEPIAVPTSIKQGIDFVYVDPQMSTVAVKKQRPRNWLQRIFRGREEEQTSAPNPLFLQIADGLTQYQNSWGALPQPGVPAGATLKPGSTGARVNTLRTRLGLAPGGGYDAALQQRVAEYQRIHGLESDGIAGRGTVTSLNLGAAHYAQKIAINMERAYRLPQTRTFERYVVVDSGAAETYLFDGDRQVDAMRVIVGTAETKTPMMAVLMRTAKANPYWNVPVDLARTLTAKRAIASPNYFRDFHYEVLGDWTANARPVDPKSINWRQVAAGRRDVRVRQLPGPWNSMGEMKFEMPNDFGIYLHDTPLKENFAKDDRWLSNGCVRLADYRRFASWVFSRAPLHATQFEQVFELPKPVPIYMTYLTVQATPEGIMFRPDPYGFDALAMPQMFAPGAAV